MMIKALLSLALLSAFTAQAATERSYSCDVVPNFDDWTVSVDLTTGEADFFDNDSHRILKSKKVRIIKEEAPVRQQTFELKKDGVKTSLTFETTMQGEFLKATLESSDAFNNSYTYDFECR